MSRKPLEQLSLGRILDPSPVSPLISTRNLVPGLSSSVVKLDKLGKGEYFSTVPFGRQHESDE